MLDVVLDKMSTRPIIKKNKRDRFKEIKTVVFFLPHFMVNQLQIQPLYKIIHHFSFPLLNLYNVIKVWFKD